MNQKQFKNLSFDDRSEYLFKNGEYITHREYYNQKRALYRCDDFLAEIWYSPLENEITKVELIGLEKALRFYWSAVEIDLDYESIIEGSNSVPQQYKAIIPNFRWIARSTIKFIYFFPATSKARYHLPTLSDYFHLHP